MVYMTRLGLWGAGTPFHSFERFRKAAEASGSIAVLMLVAMEMKVRCCFVHSKVICVSCADDIHPKLPTWLQVKGGAVRSATGVSAPWRAHTLSSAFPAAMISAVEM